MSIRVLAIDWSGRKDRAQKTIWLAEVDSATKGVLQLCNGRDRSAIQRYLIAEAERAPNLVVGLDFAFSFPAWFVKERGAEDVNQFWNIVAQMGETWLTGDAPFWGRSKKRRTLDQHLLMRATDREVPSVGGIVPKSVFQTGGAGAVGTGSIRGMPMLLQLRNAGFAIWPFDSCGLPMAIEIYPRLLTGAVRKSNAQSRAEFIERLEQPIEPAHRDLAIDSEDAFDALISALKMAEHVDDLLALKASEDATKRLEGQIWAPCALMRAHDTGRRE